MPVLEHAHARGFQGAARPVLDPTNPTPRWLGPFFDLAAASPRVTGILRPLACRLVPRVSRQVREAVRLNARRIFGRELAGRELRRFTQRVVGSFYDFVCDVGSAAASSPERIRGRITRVEGLEAYRVARAERRGAILITAHLGTFEAGLAALAGQERRIHVVFRRDASPAFDRIRSRLRGRLGIIEAPIDEGWSSWMSLREALLNDEVVVMQGDRAIPGQRSRVVPFLHGHLRLPTGPVRLARLAGSPIIPVFAPRLTGDGYVVRLEAPIEPSANHDDTDLLRLARAIERIVAEYPDQWLAFEPLFEEDVRHAS